MDISVFQVAGPVMTGPSSSHTAGAARLARIAANIARPPFAKVSFGLFGSFAETGRGHGTDKALVAGVLGFYEDDERIGDSFSYARNAGLAFDFYEADLEGMHENSARLTFTKNDGSSCEITGSSVGGGRILVKSIDGFDTEFAAETNTLIVFQKDVPGVISEISGVLAQNKINIAVMKVSRKERGGFACCIIETDSAVEAGIKEKLDALANVISVIVINV
ncbi:L-serine ammonia-lyase, iron-sulfur-dependent subunit beta [Treponema sp. HNW]|uniref:L-serine ammonia-lyase, iron-sulfur-dependent subunit beta n=1 Tax=Treponema sp. HNW TaxID=3116654 RepID=UPI003D0FE74C